MTDPDRDASINSVHRCTICGGEMTIELLSDTVPTLVAYLCAVDGLLSVLDPFDS